MYIDEIVVPYFKNNVLASYNRYVDISKNEDRNEGQLEEIAINSSYTLYRFYYLLASLFNPNTFTQQEISKLCPDFEWVADVARFSNTIDFQDEKFIGSRPTIVQHKLQIEETIVNSLYPFEGEVKYPRAYAWLMDLRIMVNPLLGEGEARDLLEINTNVYNFWVNFLAEKFGVDGIPNVRYEGNDVKIVKRDKSKAGFIETKIKLPHSSEEGTKFCMIARRYEPKTNQYEKLGFGRNGGIINLPVNQTGNTRTKIYNVLNRHLDSSIPKDSIIQLKQLIEKAQKEHYSPEQFTQEVVAINPILKFFKEWIKPKDQANLLAMLAIIMPFVQDLLKDDKPSQTIINNITNNYVMAQPRVTTSLSNLPDLRKNTNVTPPKKKRYRKK